MHTEDHEVRSSARSPTQDHPRVAEDSERFRRTPDGRATAASGPKRDTRGAPRWGASWLVLTMLCALLAALVGLLAELLKDPPAVATAIIVVTAFGALIANEVKLRARPNS